MTGICLTCRTLSSEKADHGARAILVSRCRTASAEQSDTRSGGFYQMRQGFSFAIGWPALQENAF
jgi:hypothetical protein